MRCSPCSLTLICIFSTQTLWTAWWVEWKKKGKKSFRFKRFNHPTCSLIISIINPQSPDVVIRSFSNKIDETITLDDLKKLKLAFEVEYKVNLLKPHWQPRYSFLDDLTVFFFVKEFETGGLRSTDAKTFGRIVKKCLALPQTVRQCDISLHILLSPQILSSASHFFSSLLNYLTNLH